MRNINTLLCTVFFILVVLTGCKTTIQSDERNDGPPDAPDSDTAGKRCQYRLEHFTVADNHDEKTARRDGYLRVDEYVIPDIFTYVYQNGSAYAFSMNTRRDGDTGYHPTNARLMKKDGTVMSKEERTRGWYFGSARKKNTPRCWIYVQWNGGSAFLDSEKIEQILSNPPFSAIYPISRVNTRLLN